MMVLEMYVLENNCGLLHLVNIVQEDPLLENHRREMCKLAARALDKAHMIRYDERQGYLYATDLGRTASHYYIKYDTVEVCISYMLNTTFLQ